VWQRTLLRAAGNFGARDAHHLSGVNAHVLDVFSQVGLISPPRSNRWRSGKVELTAVILLRWHSTRGVVGAARLGSAQSEIQQ